MKLTISKQTLQEAVRKVISERKSPIPILTNFLIRAQDGKLIIQGTDLEIFTTYWINADIEEEGIICVNAKKLTDISKVLPEEKVNIKTENNNLKITSGKTKYSLTTADYNDFPEFQTIDNDEYITVNAETIIKGIEKTIHATSKQEHIILNGINIKIQNNKIEFAATDGHRLAIYKEEIENNNENSINITIPAKAISEIKKLISKEDEYINIATDQHLISVSGENWKMTARLLEGKFPEYHQVIPNSFLTSIQISKNEITQAIRRVIIANEEESFKSVKIKTKENKIIITSAEPNQEIQATDEIETIQIYGEEQEIAFNGTYLLDAINQIENQDITIQLINKDYPAVIKSENDENYLAIVMPMNL